MKRLLRAAFNFVSALSLLLCIAAAALWARSYFISDWIVFRGPAFVQLNVVSHAKPDVLSSVRYELNPRACHVFSGRDRIAFWIYPFALNNRPFRYIKTSPTSFPVTETFGSSLGFSGGGDRSPSISSSGPPIGDQYMLPHLTLPLWLVVGLFAVFPAVWTRSFIRERKRRRVGKCRKCNYDLRASRDRCPECGTPIEAA